MCSTGKLKASALNVLPSSSILNCKRFLNWMNSFNMKQRLHNNIALVVNQQANLVRLDIRLILLIQILPNTKKCNLLVWKYYLPRSTTTFYQMTRLKIHHCGNYSNLLLSTVGNEFAHCTVLLLQHLLLNLTYKLFGSQFET